MKLLLTGKPGIGKTTLILNILSRCNLNCGGFYTTEMREGGKRVGFAIDSLSGEHAILAHFKYRSPFRVGRYGVDLAALEGIGVKSIEDAIKTKEIIVVDEIGKMELLSPSFAEAVLGAVKSEKHLLATMTRARNPFADMLKARRDTEVIEVTYENRGRLVDEIASRLMTEGKSHLSKG